MTFYIGFLLAKQNATADATELVNTVLQTQLLDKEFRLAFQAFWLREQAMPIFLFAVTPLTFLAIVFAFLNRGLAAGVLLLISISGPIILRLPSLYMGDPDDPIAAEAIKKAAASFRILCGLMSLNLVAGILAFFIFPEDKEKDQGPSRRRDRDSYSEEDDRRTRRGHDDEDEDRPRRRRPRDEDNYDDRPPRRRRPPADDFEDEDHPRRRPPRDEDDDYDEPRRRR